MILHYLRYEGWSLPDVQYLRCKLQLISRCPFHFENEQDQSTILNKSCQIPKAILLCTTIIFRKNSVAIWFYQKERWIFLSLVEKRSKNCDWTSRSLHYVNKCQHLMHRFNENWKAILIGTEFLWLSGMCLQILTNLPKVAFLFLKNSYWTSQ